jgi:hypothetical protein
MTSPHMTDTEVTGADMPANRVKPPLAGKPGGILGTAFARRAGRGSGRLLTRLHAGFLHYPSTGVASI